MSPVDLISIVRIGVVMLRTRTVLYCRTERQNSKNRNVSSFAQQGPAQKEEKKWNKLNTKATDADYGQAVAVVNTYK